MAFKHTVFKLVDALTDSALAKKWLSVSELHVITKASPSRIRECLVMGLRPFATCKFKAEPIPGDKHGRYQWALHNCDTTDWANASPVSLPKSTGIGRLRVKSQPAQIPITPSVTAPATDGGSMCAPTDKPSLTKAIGDLLVNEFITSGKKFTAHDVTQRMRQLVLQRAKNSTLNNSHLSTPSYANVDAAEVGEVYSCGYMIPRIDHEDVKFVVHEIFKMGGMPNIDRMIDGDHWVYDTKDNIDTATYKKAGIDPLTPPPPVLPPLTVPTLPKINYYAEWKAWNLLKC